jgi:hypothetical protein
MSNKNNEIAKKTQVETMLPYGEMLRPFISSTLISKSELKKMLANRGVYLSSNDKDHTIPLILTTLLRPEEFEQLLSCQKTRESEVKRTDGKVKWESDEDVFDVIKEYKIPYSDLVSERSSNYRILQPDKKFKMIGSNRNEVILEYELEREDPSKNWAGLTSMHEGRMILKKNENNILEISQESTASETRDYNIKLERSIKEYLIKRNCISKDDTISKILYSDFSNEERVRFLLSLHNNDPNDIFSFSDIYNITLDIDSNVELPEDISWMENKVKNIIMRGNKLHDTMFLTDPQYHHCLKVSSIEANYHFNYHAAQGNCTINYGFFSTRSKSSISNSAQFEFKITKTNTNHKNRKAVERFLRDKFNDFKNIQHKRFLKKK